jgi:hypothetical protein
MNAKTTRQVINAGLGTENWDLKALGVTEAKVDFEKPMWILSEEAQKEITDQDKIIQDGIMSHSELYEKLVSTQKQIEAAKKYVMEMQCNCGECWAEDRQELINILSVEIPRKEDPAWKEWLKTPDGQERVNQFMELEKKGKENTTP